MKNIFLAISFLPILAFGQTAPTEDTPDTAVKEAPTLVRAVDDRKQFIRQRRDLIDVNEETVFQTEVEVRQ
ncbi:MAG: hypothetical protein CME71_00610 [Halobacteriovorax sp.]|nr:hypothetical protein [Halobacteriovorax sp.]